MEIVFALLWENAAVLSCEAPNGMKIVRFAVREAVPKPVLCSNLLKRSTDG